MVPAGNNAKRLSSVNHTTKKTIHVITDVPLIILNIWLSKEKAFYRRMKPTSNVYILVSEGFQWKFQFTDFIGCPFIGQSYFSQNWPIQKRGVPSTNGLATIINNTVHSVILENRNVQQLSSKISSKSSRKPSGSNVPLVT